MVYRDIVSEAKRLPRAEQLQLVEDLLRSIRKTAEKPSRKEKARAVPFSKLRGALKTAGAPPSGESLEDEYAQYLLEKYL